MLEFIKSTSDLFDALSFKQETEKETSSIENYRMVDADQPDFSDDQLAREKWSVDNPHSFYNFRPKKGKLAFNFYRCDHCGCILQRLIRIELAAIRIRNRRQPFGHAHVQRLIQIAGGDAGIGTPMRTCRHNFCRFGTIRRIQPGISL